MVQRKRWMMEKHAGTREAHYNFNFFFHVRAIAMDDAFAAGAFFILERTFV
jgi:hypothetical protein